MRDISNHEILRTLRAQAWTRGIGELRSVSDTFWGEREQYEKYSKALKEFIELVEGNGWQE